MDNHSPSATPQEGSPEPQKSNIKKSTGIVLLVNVMMFALLIWVCATAPDSPYGVEDRKSEMVDAVIFMNMMLMLLSTFLWGAFRTRWSFILSGFTFLSVLFASVMLSPSSVKVERLFNIPVGEVYSKANLEEWVGVFEGYRIANYEERWSGEIVAFSLIPESQPDRVSSLLSGEDWSSRVDLKLVINDYAVVTMVEWESPLMSGDYYGIEDQLGLSFWDAGVRSSSEEKFYAYWDGKHVLDRGVGTSYEKVWRLWLVDDATKPYGEYEKERQAGETKLNKMFGN